MQGLRELVWQKNGGQERCKKKKRSTKCTSSPSPLKRKRTMDFLKESNSFVSLDSWTNIETCLLDAVAESFLHCTCFLPTKDNLTHSYNHVVNSRFARQLQLHVGEKTKMQVEGKLNLEKNKCMAARNLTYGVDAINRIHRNTNNGVFFFYLFGFYLNSGTYYIFMSILSINKCQ